MSIQSKVGSLRLRLNFLFNSSKADFMMGSCCSELIKICFEFNFAKSKKLLLPLGAFTKISNFLFQYSFLVLLEVIFFLRFYWQ